MSLFELISKHHYILIQRVYIYTDINHFRDFEWLFDYKCFLSKGQI